MIQRQDTPEGEIASLEDEVTEYIDMLRGSFRELLDAAYTAKVDGDPPTDWSGIDQAVRAFTYGSGLELALSIAAYIDGEQEALLAALTPEELDERVVWDVPDLTDACPAAEAYDGRRSGARVCVNGDGEWVAYMTNYLSKRHRRGHARLVRFAVAEALGGSPLDAPVQAVEAAVLDAARELAGQDAVADAAG